jgi:hypothetical protein
MDGDASAARQGRSAGQMTNNLMAAVIRVHNRKDFNCRALSSVLAQQYARRRRADGWKPGP